MSTLSTLPTLGELDQLTREIHTLEAHAVEREQSWVQFRAEIGKRLKRASEIMERGRFIPWAEAEFGWSRRTIYRHIQLFESVSRMAQIPPDLSLSMALRALVVDVDEPVNTAPRALPFVFALQPPDESAQFELRLVKGDPEAFRKYTAEGFRDLTLMVPEVRE